MKWSQKMQDYFRDAMPPRYQLTSRHALMLSYAHWATRSGS